MTALFTGFPALIYSGLWTLKTVGILERELPNTSITFLITDAPPGFKVIIKDDDFEMEILDGLESVEDLESVQTDMYIALPSHYLLGGTEGFIKGMSDGVINIKNNKILMILGKIASVF
ncbi:MAG: hypothetical protein GF317_00600 [Candidatus Lokiarchaeota archaeon]|nr:hypothetical protein [Candidatus Lokiarchaeota archaeon]MBD3198474.1 hypothetical protein [Candidatus Lokiarchaeota archaeon]